MAPPSFQPTNPKSVRHRHLESCWHGHRLKTFFLKKVGHFRPLLISFRLFNTVDIKLVNKQFANDWSLTADLWYRKRPHYQLSHNHFPFFKNFYLIRNLLYTNFFICLCSVLGSFCADLKERKIIKLISSLFVLIILISCSIIFNQSRSFKSALRKLMM